MSFTHEHPYGSARFATRNEISKAQLMKGKGMPFGFYDGRELRHHSRAGLALYGGAGSGKTTSILAPMIMTGGVLDARGKEKANILALDVKCELTAITLDGLAHTGTRAYIIDPYQMSGAKGHSVSLLSHLKASSPTLVGDSRRMWDALLPNVSGKDGVFFDAKGRYWGDAITRGIVHEQNSVSFGKLFETFNMIRADWDAWLRRAEEIAAHSPPDVEAALLEMVAMNSGEARTYDAVMSGITNALAFMADPALRDTFVEDHEADFSFEVFAETSGAPVVVLLVFPPELLAPNAAIVRQCFSTLRTVKQRAPQARPVYSILDEAAALGQYPEISEFFSIGRGFSLTPIVCYQDIGQVHRNLGQTGAMTLSANAALELFLGGGIRDFQTAKLLSDRCGSSTISIDENLIQERARHAAKNAVRAAIFEGADPFSVSLDLRQSAFEAQHIRKQRRALLEPDEILGLPADKALVLAGGYSLNPFVSDKVPYFLRRELSGRFFPNPHVNSDLNRITIATRFGKRQRRIIEERVPSWLTQLPQYALGRPFRYVEGFKPSRP